MPATLAFEYVRPPDHRDTFSGALLHADDRLIVIEHEVKRGRPLVVDGREVVTSGCRAVWFLFQGQSYDIGRFYDPDGTWTGCYVDILEPVRWHGSTPPRLQPLVDLFLDLWITPDGRWFVLDEDEMEEAFRRGAISGTQHEHARAVLDQLISKLRTGGFPPAVVRDWQAAAAG